MIEAVDLPIFGIGFSIEMTQFVFADPFAEETTEIDHSFQARQHAQHIANFIVDEARLNDNRFNDKGEEFKSLIANRADSALIEDKELPFIRLEVYLFK